jgi:hypothetical protein
LPLSGSPSRAISRQPGRQASLPSTYSGRRSGTRSLLLAAPTMLIAVLHAVDLASLVGCPLEATRYGRDAERGEYVPLKPRSLGRRLPFGLATQPGHVHSESSVACRISVRTDPLPRRPEHWSKTRHHRAAKNGLPAYRKWPGGISSSPTDAVTVIVVAAAEIS